MEHMSNPATGRPGLARAALLNGIARLYRAFSPKSGLTRLAFNAVLNEIIGQGAVPAIARTRSGDRILVDLNDYDGRVLYLFGTNDPKVEAATRALLRPGDVFLDIGANHGSIGLAAADVVGSAGHVHLFEPQSRLGATLGGVIATRPTQNATLHAVGLLDRDATLQLRAPEQHSGMASFIDAATFDGPVRTETCEVKAIQTYLPPLIRGRYFGVKLDVEGAEPTILPWLVDQPNLVFLICEVAQNRREILQMFWQNGFESYGLVKSPLALQLSRFRDERASMHFHDVLAVRRDKFHALPDQATPVALGRALKH